MEGIGERGGDGGIVAAGSCDEVSTGFYRIMGCESEIRLSETTMIRDGRWG